MKKFLAIYTCAENSKNHEAWKLLDQETQKERMQKGMVVKENWEKKYKDRVVFEGSSLGKRTKKIDAHGIHDVPSEMGAFIIVEANSHDEAAKMFLEHPHFIHFPGDGVDVMEFYE